MENQLAKMHAYWIAQRNITTMQTQLDGETDAYKRGGLERLLVEQRKLIASD
jgi:hypothetical protein